MNILHCIWLMEIGGSETMLVDILNRQSVDNNVALVIVNNIVNPDLIAAISPRVKIYRINRVPHSRNPFPVLRFNHIIRRFRPDIVHIHNSDLPRLIFGKPGKARLYTIHALNIHLRRPKKLSACIAISETVKDDFAARFPQIPVVTIPNGIDTSKIAVRPPEDEHRPLRIVQVGRLKVSEKGQDVLIEALGILRGRGITDVRLTLIGDGGDMQMLRDLTAESGLQEQVEFLGAQSRQYIYSHLCDYDLMCHPSRSEGFGLTVAEAMAAGLPVLVPDHGGPVEIIDNGRYGEVFPGPTPESCADAIERIMRDYPAALAVADEARRYAIETYSIDTQVRRYLDLYTTLIH